jgi:hypothetical protein
MPNNYALFTWQGKEIRLCRFRFGLQRAWLNAKFQWAENTVADDNGGRH